MNYAPQMTLIGRIEDVDSNMDEHVIHFGVSEPYNHTVLLTVTGDPGAEDASARIEALASFFKCDVEVIVTIDEHGELRATPSCFRRAEEGQKAGSRTTRTRVRSQACRRSRVRRYPDQPSRPGASLSQRKAS